MKVPDYITWSVFSLFIIGAFGVLMHAINLYAEDVTHPVVAEAAKHKATLEHAQEE
jgi:hypothetical protein